MNASAFHPFPHDPRFLALSIPAALLLSVRAPTDDDACPKTADKAYHACRSQALADYWLQRGKCLNLPTPAERAQCAHDALAAYQEAREECAEQRAARIEVCERLGGAPYHPAIDPADFVRGVDHPFLPLIPGTTLVYERTGEGFGPGRTEHTEVTVLDETKEILGVDCTVVHDVVTLGGVLVEDTFDWFAQDVHGNVWYFGEQTLAYADGAPASLEGSWKAGVDGASPGIVMPASPEVGDFYRQEFLLGEAEDLAGTLSLADPVAVPAGSFPSCLLTEEITPREPGSVEHKDYAAGIGLVLTLEADGTRTELVAIRR